jgi:O-antigen/teichoic acid export membrane protein
MRYSADCWCQGKRSVSSKLSNLIKSFLERFGTRFWLVTDRGILAATSMVVVVTLARLLDVPTFGAFSTILAIWFVVEVLLRGAVLNPLVVFSGQSSQPAYLFGSWLFLTLVVALVGAAVILAPLSVLLDPASYAHEVTGNALFIVLPYAAFHSLRRALIQKRLQQVSLAMSTCLFLANGTAMAAMWAGVLPADLAAACISIGGANLLAAGLGWYLGAFPVALSRRYLRRLFGRLVKRRSVIFSTLLLEVPGTGLFSILLGAFGGAAETAHYIAARTLLRPVGIILSAMDDADRTQASHALGTGKAVELARWYRSARFIPAAIALVPLVPIFLFSGQLAALVYGDKFHGLGPVIRLSAVLFLIFGWLLPKVIYLITSGHERELAQAALIAFCATLLMLGACVAAGYATAVGFSAVEICGGVLLTGLVTLKIERSRLTTPSAAAPALLGEVPASGPGQT